MGQAIRDQGLGVGYRPSFRDAFLGGAGANVSWIEVISENHFRGADGADTRALQTLRGLRRDFPVAIHGIGLNLAGAEPLNVRYLAELAQLVKTVEPFLVTDHLCWTGLGRENLFDLLPFPFTRESLDHVVGKVQRVQELLGRPIAVENLTYYTQPAGDELGEAEFLNELCARTGCRMLLDINNIYVNGVNFGRDPDAYLSQMKAENVAEVHLAGHSARENGLLIDTHGAPVKDDVWALYERALARLGCVPTMIERDQNIPAWEAMETELVRLRGIRAPFLTEVPRESTASRLASARS